MPVLTRCHWKTLGVYLEKRGTPTVVENARLGNVPETVGAFRRLGHIEPNVASCKKSEPYGIVLNRYRKKVFRLGCKFRVPDLNFPPQTTQTYSTSRNLRVGRLCKNKWGRLLCETLGF